MIETMEKEVATDTAALIWEKPVLDALGRFSEIGPLDSVSTD